MSRRLSARDMLVLLEMCLDAEDRCAERALGARQAGDHAGVERALRLQERYARLRYSVIEQMEEPVGSRAALPQGEEQSAPEGTAARSARSAPVEPIRAGGR